jgi:hypothetical protein
MNTARELGTAAFMRLRLERANATVQALVVPESVTLKANGIWKAEVPGVEKTAKVDLVLESGQTRPGRFVVTFENEDSVVVAQAVIFDSKSGEEIGRVSADRLREQVNAAYVSQLLRKHRRSNP